MREIIEAVARTINAMIEGEILDTRARTTSMSEAEYRNIAAKKTGRLFALSASLPALLLGESTGLVKQAEFFGESFGIFYQMVDDWLDIFGDPKTAGKPLGQNLVDSKPNIVLILGRRKVPESVWFQIEPCIGESNASPSDMRKVAALLRREGIDEMSRLATRAVLEEVLESLPQKKLARAKAHLRGHLDSLLRRTA